MSSRVWVAASWTVFRYSEIDRSKSSIPQIGNTSPSSIADTGHLKAHGSSSQHKYPTRRLVGWSNAMSSQPIDEDGFHSIAWDDAPPRATSAALTSPLDDDNEGFETISPPSATSPAQRESFDRHDGPSSSGQKPESALLASRNIPGGRGDDIDPSEWKGHWMSIEVRDPVKEHEGSKDMYVSYAVRTKVGRKKLWEDSLADTLGRQI